MKTFKRIGLLFCLSLLFVLLSVSAEAVWTYYLEDNAELFSTNEEKMLLDELSSLSKYLDAAVLTEDGLTVSTRARAQEYVESRFGSDAALVFLIDMTHREIYIYCNSAALKIISSADARAVTDNVYQYASKGSYYRCASEALSQIRVKCAGGRIARPVKHITNALIALLGGVLMNFFLVTKSRQPQEDAVSASYRMAVLPDLTVEYPHFLDTRRVDHRSGGGGGRGGRGGGGRGGGGGHSF